MNTRTEEKTKANRAKAGSYSLCASRVLYDKSVAEIRMKLTRPNMIALLTALLAIAFATLNIMAYRHAHAMLHFAESGDRTNAPESLSVLHKIKVLIFGVNIPRPVNTGTPSDVGVQFSVHRFESGDGTPLEGWFVPVEQSKGLALIFHGYSSSRSDMLGNITAFHKLGFSTFTIDFRGSGNSGGNCTSIGYVEAGDVIAAVNYSRSNCSPKEPTILYGVSMGGAAILKAIAANRLKPDMIILEAVFDRMLTTVKARFAAMGIPSFPSAHLLTFWGSKQMGFSGFNHNPADYASNVQCPTLVLHGEKDPRATLQQGKNIFEELPCKKQMVIFDDVGHESCYEANPEKWICAVSRFLAR